MQHILLAQNENNLERAHMLTICVQDQCVLVTHIFSVVEDHLSFVHCDHRSRLPPF